MTRNSGGKNHFTETLFAVWALFDTLNIRKNSKPTPNKTSKPELLEVVYSLLRWHQGGVQVDVKENLNGLLKQQHDDKQH